MEMGHQAQLLAKRKFFPLLLTLFWGAFNDNVLKNALIFLVTFSSVRVLGFEPNQVVAVATGLLVLPFFLFSAIAGQLADKFEKSLLIQITKLFELFLMVFATIGFVTENYVILLILIFLMGVQSTFFGPLKYGILPQHLSKTELVGGNALVGVGTFLAILIGSVTGAVIEVVENGILIICSVLVVASSFGFIASLYIPKAAAAEPHMKINWDPVTSTWRSFLYIFENKSVTWSILGISWFWFLGTALLVVLPDYAKINLGVGPTVLAAFMVVFTVGIAIGSLLCERLSRIRLEIGLVPFGSIGLTIALLALGGMSFLIDYNGDSNELLGLSEFIMHPQSILIVIALFFTAMFSGFFIVPLQTLIQQRSHPARLARVLAGNNILNALFMVLASFGTFFLLSIDMHLGFVFLIFAGLTALVSYVIYNLVPEFLLRFILWIVSTLLYRLKVKGLENIPEDSAAVLVCNHVSFVDWLLIGGAIKRPIRFIMTYHFFRGFLIKKLLKRGKVIPIGPKKEKPELYEQAFRRAAEELQAGELVCIFPEGKLTFDGEMNEFRPGVEKIIKETPVPVIPMALKGLWGSFFTFEGRGALKTWPKKLWANLELEIGKPIPPDQVKTEKLEQIVAQMRGPEK